MEDVLTAIFIGLALAVGALLVAMGVYFVFVHPGVEDCREAGGTTIGGKCIDVKEIRL